MWLFFPKCNAFPTDGMFDSGVVADGAIVSQYGVGTDFCGIGNFAVLTDQYRVVQLFRLPENCFSVGSPPFIFPSSKSLCTSR